MKKNTKLVALFKELKNSLSAETKTEVMAAFEAAIAEAESAEAEISKDDLISLVEEKMSGLATVAQIAEMQNMINNKFTMKNTNEYLKTKKSLTDFYNVIKNSSRDTYKENWAKVCKTEIKNDIDPDGVLLPAAISTAIIDNINKAGTLFSLLNKTGLKAIKVPVNTLAEDETTGRAGRHTKGTTKDAQVWDLAPKTILAQAIFKLLPVDYETLRQVEDEAALVRYIVAELTNFWTKEVEMAILVGDGRSTSDSRHITSFETIAVSASTPYITVVDNTASPAVPTMELVREAVDSIESEGRLVLVMSKQNKTLLAEHIYATGGTTRYASDAELAGQLGVDSIITNKHVTEANGALAIVIDVDAYNVVGDTTPEQINQYDIYKNQNVFELVGLAGGGLVRLKSAAVVKP
jgi:hypothetical protein